MKIGNWDVSQNKISWAGEERQSFSIEKNALLEKEKLEILDDYDLYKWILVAMQEDWITEDDLYDLNFAFVYASGAWQQPLDYEIFDRTVEYQFELLEDEDDDDDDEY